ncbi:MAG TPA: ACT domain-containing protein, partial [Bacillaceae bacterium]
QIDVDIIIQSQTDGNKTNLSFSIKNKDRQETVSILESQREEIGFDHTECEAGLAKVSIVGSGMVSNPGVAARMFEVLAAKGIQIKMVSTSEIKVSAVIDQDKMETAAKTLHDAFQLGNAALVK